MYANEAFINENVTSMMLNYYVSCEENKLGDDSPSFYSKHHATIAQFLKA